MFITKPPASHFLLTIFLIFARPALCLAEANDIILQAMQDEITRSIENLKIKGRQSPYFISYRVTEYDTQRFNASNGALTDDSCTRWRSLKTDVREGDYHLDNTGYISPSSILNNNATSTITTDNDYDAIRNTLWLRTDTAYKAAIKNLEAKKAFLEQNNIQERPDDFSREAITVLIDKPVKEENCSHWQSITKEISAIFRDFPAIQRSTVNFTANKVTNWFVNSEGTKVRESENQYSFIVMASLQADNGMQLADNRTFCANSLSALPKETDINQSVREMINKLIALKSVSSATEYRGPILLEGQASAEFINSLIRRNLGHAQEILSSNENLSLSKRNPLKNLVGQSIMPPFLTVVDDPLTEKFHGHLIIGGHKIDEDGIPAQKITLVDKGVLKTFCTSRTPTNYTKNSNGHSIGGVGEASVLYINSDNQASIKDLKENLIALGKKSGLKKVMIARRLSTYDSAIFNPSTLTSEIRANTSTASSNSLFVRSPLLLYSVSVDDGKEELVRGALFSAISLSVLRNIVCTGNDSQPYLTLSLDPAELAYYDLVCPSLLLNEIELHTADKETDKLPILSSPLAEK